MSNIVRVMKDMQQASLGRLAAIITLVAAPAVLPAGPSSSAPSAISTPAHVCPPAC